MKEMLERSSCKELGLNPKAVYDFVKKCLDNDLGMNSFMLVKDGKVASEGYCNPYTNDTNHVMFSISKSITATALSFAIAEGKISLDDSVSKFFPEYDKLRYNRPIKIRHLITMTAGKLINMAAARHHKDWLKIFFNAPILAKPGKIFFYTNDYFYMISAIISKVYGETLVDFLMPRLFEPLGIEKPFWETDDNGYAAGGWGLYLDIESLTKIMVCYANNGVYNGKQVLTKEWVEQATSYQVPTVKYGHIDGTKGYGFSFWQTSMPNTYRAYGLYGQTAMVFKDHNAVLVINSSLSRDEDSMDAIHELNDHLWEGGNEEYQEKLDELLSNLPDRDNLPVNTRNWTLEEKYDKKLLRTSSNTFASMLPLTISTVHNESMGYIDRFSFRKDGDDLYMMWKENTYINEIKLGMNNEYAETEIDIGGMKMHAFAKASWTKASELTVNIRIAEGCTMRTLAFDFSNEWVTRIKNYTTPDLPTLALHYINFAGIVLPQKLDNLILEKIAPVVLLVGEPTFFAK